MQRRKNANPKKRKQLPLNEFMKSLQTRRRGFFNLKPRQRFHVTTDFRILLNNATVLSPYSYAYLNVSNPVKSNGGAATQVFMWSILTAMMRKYLITHVLVEMDIENQETFATIPALGAVNYLPPNTVAQAQLTLNQPQTIVRMISGVGSPNRTKISLAIDLQSYGGFNPKNSEDAHWGGLTPVLDPADNMYAHICVDTGGVANVAALLVNVRIGFFGIAAEFNETF